MSYPGNPEIPADIQKRLLDAFDEALNLAEMGKREEASLGCDFILRTDPLFENARVLLARVKQATGPISVDDLRGADVFGGLSLPSLDLGFQDPGGDIRTRIMAALEQRRLEEAVNLGMEHAAEIAEDHDLLHHLQLAQTRLEARPYIQQFFDSARNAAAAGNLLERDRWLGKIRALDPENPGLAEFYDAAPTVSTTGLFQPIGGFDFTPMLPPDEPVAQTPAPPTREDSLARFAQAFESESAVEPSGTNLSALGSSGVSLPSAGGTGSSGVGLQPSAPVFSQPLDNPSLIANYGDLGAALATPKRGGPPPAPGEDERVQTLLDEGQAAFDRGEIQSAIDAWSRIFLIDIDHAEANRRIEMARQVKAEADRRIEEMFHEGVTKFDAGDTVGARKLFEQLLQIQPGYLSAREYITQIDSGSGVVLPRLSDTPLGPAEAGPRAGARAGSAAAADAAPARRERPARPAVAAETGPKAVPKKGAGGIVRIAGIALLVGVGGWLAWSNRASWMPGAGEAAPPPQNQVVDPIERAKRLHAEGKTSSALQALRRIPAGTPEAEVAKALIAEWEALENTQAGPTPEALRQQGELLAAAQSAATGLRFRDADRLYTQAAAILPLPASSADAALEAKAHVDALAPQLSMFRDGSWEEALPTLWRLHEASPSDRDVSQLLAAAYVNLAIRELQREAPKEALPNLKEALTVEPGDSGALRLQAFAESYAQKVPDLQYRIFVKYLSYRS
jgi:tetratricopeptide (TPR) repeat protein